MNTLEFTVVACAGSCLAGFLGALTGMGGGIIVTPLLTLALGVNIRYAIGATLISVIATSSGAAAAYVKEGISNIRIGMFLEIATTLGALAGVKLALHLHSATLAIIFGFVLLYSAFESFRTRREVQPDKPPDRIASFLRMDSSYPSLRGLKAYRVHAVPAGFGVMFGAGIVSGLLGIGSGALKVIAMDQVMGIPFKVSTTTSNFMIGVTAAASAGIYLKRGYVNPAIAMPVMVGVLLGAFLGARVLPKTKSRVLELVFGGVVTVLAIEMLYHGFAGGLR
jgi:uncharacterized protein